MKATMFVTLMVGLAACGSSSSNSAPPAMGGSQVTCTVGHNYCTTEGTPSACLSCLASSCGSEWSAAFGSDPVSFGGECRSFVTCVCDADPTTTDCYTTTVDTTTCTQASDAIDPCVRAHCDPACTGLF